MYIITNLLYFYIISKIVEKKSKNHAVGWSKHAGKKKSGDKTGRKFKNKIKYKELFIKRIKKRF